ncbi:hypothetical protein BJ875DRAFT_441083 [Amylocarpus encephaloides]|uniref:Uncharacterized protein n=1 Tax=Amylocarpus encephaloides TaxID=45428 RepID=A0A9P7YIU8_9HELO|nr:hypothetical protein BJ875DRAFT_441083 [Amylocarpus encephaloides]
MSRAPPAASLCVSVLFLLAWIFQYAFWTTCDTDISENAGLCRHWPRLGSNGIPDLVWVRFTFVLLRLIGNFVLMVFTAMAVHFEKRSNHGFTSGSGDARNRQPEENYEL